MDGTLDRLVQLEEEKWHALVQVDPEGYERAVDEQTRLTTHLPCADAIDDPAKLKAFARLAELNRQLYENLLATTLLPAAAGQLYSEDGRTDDPAIPAQTFSAKA
jgi:hypothetical protein